MTPIATLQAWRMITLVLVVLALAKTFAVDGAVGGDAFWSDWDSVARRIANDSEWLTSVEGASYWTPLHFAAALSTGDIVNRMIDLGADPNAFDVDGRTALHVASASGLVSIVQVLLDHDADIDAESDVAWSKVGIRAGQWTPLHEAASAGHSIVVRALLDRGARVDPIHYAGTLVDEADEDRVWDRDRRRRRLSVGGQLTTALHLAAIAGNVNIISMLLNERARIDADDVHQMTALHYAIRGKHTDAAIALLENGARVDILNRWHLTALDEAAQQSVDMLAAIEPTLLLRSTSPRRD